MAFGVLTSRQNRKGAQPLNTTGPQMTVLGDPGRRPDAKSKLCDLKSRVLHLLALWSCEHCQPLQTFTLPTLQFPVFATFLI